MNEQNEKIQKLLIIGDSIADCGRARPVGVGFPDALGGGYPKLLYAMTTVEHPEWHLQVVNNATSGDRTRELLDRWQTDCLDLAPDWVFVMIGVNDVWRRFDMPFDPAQAVPVEEYRANLRKLAESAMAAGSRVLFGSPFYLEANRADPMRAAVDEYRAVMRETAGAVGAAYVDVQEPFDALLSQYSTYCLAADRVHPNPVAQYVIAKAVFGALEFLLRGEKF